MCSATLSFENSVCLSCAAAVGYLRSQVAMAEPGPDTAICDQLDVNGCNWLVEEADESRCLSCRLTRTRPRDEDEAGMRQWRLAEAAKRRLVFGLDELRLPVRISDGFVGIAVNLLSSTQAPVTTGYHNGVITVDLAEADLAVRTRRQQQLAEPYRTMLGHLRHEFGHYYDEVLVVVGTPWQERYVEVFGDPSTPYEQALQRHYDQGPPPDWHQHYVSAYASMHPTEDFAECLAHYQHIQDTLQTASQWGLTTGTYPDTTTPFDQVLHDAWLPTSVALNEINRSMGSPDLYPFVLSETVIAKLGYVGEVVASAS